MNCCNRRCRQGRECPLNLEEADAPVSTPEQTMTWSALVWALSGAVGAAVLVTLALNWPLFLAAVK
jgi:hypothetical protein